MAMDGANGERHSRDNAARTKIRSDAAGGVVRVGIIYNPQTAPYAGLFLRSAEAAAPTLGVETLALPVRSETDIAAALTSLAQRPGSGLVATTTGEQP